MALLRVSLFVLSLQAVHGALKANFTNNTRGLADADAAPAHAGCFVKKGNAMLAVKLTYDGNKFDIPGGCTNGREPAKRTAERETWEESGYPVEVNELLATVRGGFRIYRCSVKQQDPGKGPDHEVSSVQWINPWEVDNFMQQHMWRYQDEQAYLYAQWLREGAENHEQNHDGGHRRLIMV
ncbi:unnamed protein product [Symbiodinium pilosum]|uniref:Nudix hydrolase domain-containing protein n=1 Tax=Symbiodinium pilosum TaxID=2952 RepID=A0A812TVZ1_SYMPI|nr:unnamed protein product [Symbiodinium pilosum]